MKNRSLKMCALLFVVVFSAVVVYRFLNREIVLYQNRDIDGYGFTASVTCRPDQMFTYYAYITIEAPNGLEVARSQISGEGYEAFKACTNSFPVERLELISREAGVRFRFKGRNAFGDADGIDIPVRFFSPR